MLAWRTHVTTLRVEAPLVDFARFQGNDFSNEPSKFQRMNSSSVVLIVSPSKTAIEVDARAIVC